jgi:hypothetical protein
MHFCRPHKEEETHQNSVDVAERSGSIRIFYFYLVSIPDLINLFSVGRQGSLSIFTVKSANN